MYVLFAQSLANFFKQEGSISVIQKLSDAGVNLKSKGKRKIKDSRFQGKIFVLTGTLTEFSRSVASERILDFGGKVSGSVSKKTSYVLAGEEAGSKLDKARALGVTIINETEFGRMIES